MRTLAALLLLSAPALAQEPPRPPQDAEARERRIRDLETAIRDLETRINEVKASLESLPKDSAERSSKEKELLNLEFYLRALRPRPPDEAPLQEGDRNRSQELERKIRALRQQLVGAPEDEKERLTAELRRLEEEQRRTRPPGQPPQPPGPSFPPGAERRRPIVNPEEVRSWLKENEPETYRKLMAVQNDGRRPEVLDMLAGAEGRMHEMNEMKTRDPKGYERLVAMRKLEQETIRLGESARQAPPEEREKLSAQMKEQLSKLFDLREEARTRELEELKRRVGDLEKALAGRKANKDRIVENRRRVLLGDRPDDDW